MGIHFRPVFDCASCRLCGTIIRGSLAQKLEEITQGMKQRAQEVRNAAAAAMLRPAVIDIEKQWVASEPVSRYSDTAAGIVLHTNSLVHIGLAPPEDHLTPPKRAKCKRHGKHGLRQRESVRSALTDRHENDADPTKRPKRAQAVT